VQSRVSAAAERLAGGGRMLRRGLSVLVSMALVGCGGPGKPAAAPGPAPVFLGAVASPEPLAGQVARRILAEGGNAADAAVALGFALAVTLPSRAGLGGGGACVVYDPSPKGPDAGKPGAILFLPAGPAGAPIGDRPAAVPMLARGLYLLHARYGRLPVEQLLGDAQAMARLGVAVSPAFANDLAAVAGPLLADPAARAVFAGPSGAPLAAGQPLVQPDLAATLSELRVEGIGDFYQGPLARHIAVAAMAAGGGLTASDFARAVPAISTPIAVSAGVNRVAFLPPPADGGLAAAAAFTDLWQNPGDLQGAGARAVAVAAQWRAGGGDPVALLAAKNLPPASLPPLPASTAFATLDATGGAVACAVTMNNLFGTGRIAPGTGILLASAPSNQPLPLLAAGIAWNNNIQAFRAAVAGSGQNGAALAVAAAMADALRIKPPAVPGPVPEPGRVQVIACSRAPPVKPPACVAATDPRAGGFAFSGS
jgi:gamma-glutamyltranspeptidase / glutathione hydrolase